jgi:hypothetical protein
MLFVIQDTQLHGSFCVWHQSEAKTGYKTSANFIHARQSLGKQADERGISVRKCRGFVRLKAPMLIGRAQVKELGSGTYGSVNMYLTSTYAVAVKCVSRNMDPQVRAVAEVLRCKHDLTIGAPAAPAVGSRVAPPGLPQERRPVHRAGEIQIAGVCWCDG